MGARVIEVKRLLDGTERRFACQPILIEPGRRAILRYVLERPWTVAGMPLDAGTATYAHFWMERPFNVYHWVQSSQTIGLYFNVGPCDEIAEDRVVWRDYAVDVLATPGGEPRVLDEDELPPDVAPAIRTVVERARAEILATLPALAAEVERETRRRLGAR